MQHPAADQHQHQRARRRSDTEHGPLSTEEAPGGAPELEGEEPGCHPEGADQDARQARADGTDQVLGRAGIVGIEREHQQDGGRAGTEAEHFTPSAGCVRDEIALRCSLGCSQVGTVLHLG